MSATKTSTITREEDTKTQTKATQQGSGQPADKTAMRPFRVNVPEAELTELRRRILATRFPEQETVADFSQGVQLAFIQALARYWATDYDWRRCEAQLNALPQFHHRDRRAGYPLHSRPVET